jgi:cytochrome P450
MADSLKDALFARSQLRAEHAQRSGPVWWDERFDGWAVSSYALVTEVLRAPRVFSARELEVGPPAPHAETPILRSLIGLDPPEHYRLREVVGLAFTPRALAQVESAIEHTAAQLMRDRTAATVDVVGEFAAPLTTSMLAQLLGLPTSRDADFVRWTHVVAAFIGPAAEDPVRQDEFRQVLAEMEAFLHESRTASIPSGTVLATLSGACSRGALTERELCDFLILLIAAGHETTTRLIYHAVLCLDREPAVLDALRERPERIAVFVEEVARFLPPTGGVDRFTAEPAVLAGTEIGRGERVVALLGAANRDPSVFADPHRFDPERFAPGRRPARHLGFGSGVHVCLGAHLARREARIALACLIEHVPGRWNVPETGIEAGATPVGIDIHRMMLTTP